MAENSERITLYFDGVCNLCNAWVSFLVERDKARRFRYAPLQGETFQKLLAEEPALGALDSLIVVREKADGTRQILTHSAGPIFLAGELGGLWSVAKVFRILPAFVRDAMYKLIARLRYVLFGKKESCRLPTPEERALFLP